MPVIDSSLENGVKLIVVNPRKTPLAKRADIHAQLRPGTDSALALGLLNVIISEQLYDKQFVEEWTVGFDSLVEHVKKYPPEEMERITWVPADSIRQFARIYATSKPACISLGISLEHCTNGIQAIRAITTLIAITGNHDIPGGNRCIDPLSRISVRVKEKVSAKPFNDKYPLFMGPLGGEVPVHSLPEVILTEKPYPIKALIVQGGNPVIQWPNASRVIEAFKKLDLLVCMDFFMTETADLAHIFLPACTFLERTEIRPLYQAYLPLCSLRVPAIEPVGESLPDWKFWFELGKRMGYEEYFPWEDIEQATNYYLEPSGITMRALKHNPQGIFWGDKDSVRRYREKGFPTPSHKVEVYSENMGKLGYDPLPTYHEPAESPISQPDLAKEYPFILIAGSRINVYTHSRYRNVTTLRKRYPEPLMGINAEDAEKLSINEGDMVVVESPRGSIKIKAQVTDDIPPGVIHVDYGWGGEANVNYLVDDTALDPISGFPGFKSSLCRVRKAEK
jgi:anaerobic selenocysteine-containing dehydrogenase